MGWVIGVHHTGALHVKRTTVIPNKNTLVVFAVAHETPRDVDQLRPPLEESKESYPPHQTKTKKTSQTATSASLHIPVIQGRNQTAEGESQSVEHTTRSAEGQFGR